jgi:glycosyltransferase involved in cell wall biosynthesis
VAFPERPRVSVIVPTYNWSGVLRHAVASALGQRFADFELLVVGDGCDDDSAEVVASFRDPRVRWHNLEANSGSQAAPVNAGHALARGEYIAYLGHDDLWLPHHLGTLVEALDATGADLACTLATLVLPDGGRWVSGMLLPGEDVGLMGNVAPSSLAHRRSVLERAGPWPDHREVRRPPDSVWQRRARAAGCSLWPVQRLGVIKLASSQRPGSYLRRDDREQREWRGRIEADANALERDELMTLLQRAQRRELHRVLGLDSTFRPPGDLMRRLAVSRGLVAGETRTMAALPPAIDAATLRLQLLAVPPRVPAGATFVIHARVANGSGVVVCSEAPHPVNASYRWFADGSAVADAAPVRSVLPEPVEPGDAREIQIQVAAPAKPGTYELAACLVQELVRWLDTPADALPRAAVEVTAEPAPPPVID